MGPIGSAVLTFIGYKQTERQAKFINRLMFLRMKELEMKEKASKSLLANVLDIDDDFR